MTRWQLRRVFLDNGDVTYTGPFRTRRGARSSARRRENLRSLGGMTPCSFEVVHYATRHGDETEGYDGPTYLATQPQQEQE